MSSSFLDNQLAAWKSNLSSTSGKVASKRGATESFGRTATPPLSGQPPNGDFKRKQAEQHVTYSQPLPTGTGVNIMTQVSYAMDHLKQKRTALTFDAIWSYLSVAHQEQKHAQALEHILKDSDRVKYTPGENGKKGTFEFRPFNDISSKETLLAYLQAQRTAQGLPVKELREGWPEANDVINQLGKEGELLVLRDKNENPKTVWSNDPSLSLDIAPELAEMWKKLKLPEQGDLVAALRKNGLMTADKHGTKQDGPKQEIKKTKKPRRGGKTTNTHMAGVLRDYSHMKK